MGQLNNIVDYRDSLISIADNLLEGIAIVDREGEILYANMAFKEYVNGNTGLILGKDIRSLLPNSSIIEVLKGKKSYINKKGISKDSKIFTEDAASIIRGKEFLGAFLIVRDITENEELTHRIDKLEMKVLLNEVSDVFSTIVGRDGSLKNTIIKAQKVMGSIGGPRDSIITGENGTGKTILANAMYYYAKKIGALKDNAPFIEVNCSQFLNSDTAAAEIFGVEADINTGTIGKKGLFEIANGGMILLQEVQALGQHQSMIVKKIESGIIRRIGGARDIVVDVVVISTSSQNIKKSLIPDLYQMLAQSELYLPPFRERPDDEKRKLIRHIIYSYQNRVKERYDLNLKINFTRDAEEMLLNSYLPRNLKQLKDIIYTSIDSAAPLINEVSDKSYLNMTVDVENIPFDCIDSMDNDNNDMELSGLDKIDYDLKYLDKTIKHLHDKGMGPRKIAHILKDKGYDIEYYQVAYKLKKLNMDSEKTKRL